MRKTLFWLCILTLTCSLAPAQDAATQQQIDQINGRIQDLIDAQAAQGKRIDALEKSVSDLSDKLNQPAANIGAGADDLNKLAQQVKELAKKQQDDNDLVLKELEKLAKGGSISATSHRSQIAQPPPPTGNSSPDAGGRQNGYYYEVKAGDTLLAIAKAYSAQLKIRITTDQLLAANPGLNPKDLKVGQKVWIPQPAQ